MLMILMLLCVDVGIARVSRRIGKVILFRHVQGRRSRRCDHVVRSTLPETKISRIKGPFGLGSRKAILFHFQN
jgi:hypothetical protein